MVYFYRNEAEQKRKGAPGMIASGSAPEIGDTSVFIPAAELMQSYGNVTNAQEYIASIKVTGVCEYVNAAHHFARYRYPSPGGGSAFECFKF